MVKLIIFDLDGVLIDSKNIHFKTLNKVLSKINKKYIISKKDQKNIYEGLPTIKKLEILTNLHNLPKELYEIINKKKQEYTIEEFKKIKLDNELIKIFSYLKEKKIMIGVASNSTRKTLDMCLHNLGIDKYIDISLSNEDVVNPKPNPEIYIKCINYFNVDPNFVIIFEDSKIGIQAAKASGSKVIEITKRSDINLKFIKNIIEEKNE